MEKIKKELISLLESTIDFYTKNKLSYHNDNAFCPAYLTSDNRVCAIGRLVKFPEKLEEINSPSGNNANIRFILENNPEVFVLKDEYSFLKKEHYSEKDYENLIIPFLKKLQGLHDDIFFWDTKNKKLSKEGDNYANEIGIFISAY